jgi:hypothetical protein
MINLNIITRCTRTSFLDKIYEQVFAPGKFNVTWWILFDLTDREFDLDVFVKFSKKNINLRFFYGVPGDMGHTYLNEIYSQIEDGYIYNLDDDNSLHENFYERIYNLIEQTSAQIIVFDQYVGGKDFSGLEVRSVSSENMKVSKVDFAQIVFKKHFSEDTKFVSNYYCGDGVFIEELYQKYSEEFLFVNEVLCYYNYFTNLFQS